MDGDAGHERHSHEGQGNGRFAGLWVDELERWNMYKAVNRI